MADSQHHLLVKGYTAGGTIVANRFVKWHSTDGQVVAAGAGDPVLGVALHSASSGEQVEVGRFGIFMVEAGAAISQDAIVGADASGKAAGMTLNAAGTADNDVAGVAETAAAADGDLISVFIGRNTFTAT